MTIDSSLPPNQSAAIAKLALRNSVWMSIGNNIQQVLGFVVMLVLTRLLNAEVFGFFSLATFWFGLLNLRSKAGLNYAAIQHPQTDGKLLGTYYVLELITVTISLLLSVGAFFVLPQWLGYSKQVAIGLLFLMGIEFLGTLFSPIGMFLEKELRLSRAMIGSLIGYSLAYLVAIGLAWVGMGVWSLLSIGAVTFVVAIIFTFTFLRQLFTQIFEYRWHFDRQLAIQLLKQGFVVGLSMTALASIVNSFDNFLIGTYVSAEALGYYDRAYRIASWPTLLFAVMISRIGFITFAKVQNDMPRLTHAVRLSLWLLTTTGIPISILLFFTAPDLIALAYGTTWHESAYFLRFLFVYSLTWPFVSLATTLAMSLGHRRSTVSLAATQAVAMFVFTTPLTLWYGATGTVIGVALTMLVAFGVSCRYLFSQVSLQIAEIFTLPLIASAGMIALLWWLTTAQFWNQLPLLPRFTLMCGSGVSLYLSVLFLMNRQEVTERMTYLIKTFRGAN